MVKRRKQKARKAGSRRSARKTKPTKAKSRTRARAKTARRRAKAQIGSIATIVEAVEESAALRRRLAGRNTFED